MYWKITTIPEPSPAQTYTISIVPPMHPHYISTIVLNRTGATWNVNLIFNNLTSDAAKTETINMLRNILPPTEYLPENVTPLDGVSFNANAWELRQLSAKICPADQTLLSRIIQDDLVSPEQYPGVWPFHVARYPLIPPATSVIFSNNIITYPVYQITFTKPIFSATILFNPNTDRRQVSAFKQALANIGPEIEVFISGFAITLNNLNPNTLEALSAMFARDGNYFSAKLNNTPIPEHAGLLNWSIPEHVEIVPEIAGKMYLELVAEPEYIEFKEKLHDENMANVLDRNWKDRGLCCYISAELMYDPVKIITKMEDGKEAAHYFERSDLYRWIASGNPNKATVQHPVTREEIPIHTIFSRIFDAPEKKEEIEAELKLLNLKQKVAAQIKKKPH